MWKDNLCMIFADVNLRNGRGMTVLHVAAWRMEPQALGNLIAKGARLKEYTPDNQRALDICRRLVKKSQSKGDEFQKDNLCIEILKEAENNVATKIPSSAVAMMALPSTEENLMSTLLYLENRGLYHLCVTFFHVCCFLQSMQTIIVLASSVPLTHMKLALCIA